MSSRFSVSARFAFLFAAFAGSSSGRRQLHPAGSPSSRRVVRRSRGARDGPARQLGLEAARTWRGADRPVERAPLPGLGEPCRGRGIRSLGRASLGLRTGSTGTRCARGRQRASCSSHTPRSTCPPLGRNHGVRPARQRAGGTTGLRASTRRVNSTEASRSRRPAGSSSVSSRPVPATRVPVVFVDDALPCTPPRDRGIALASAPYLLFLLFYARGKSLYYYTPEFLLFFASVAYAAFLVLGAALSRFGITATRFRPTVASVGIAGVAGAVLLEPSDPQSRR